MARSEQTFVAPPSLAVAAGATTPDPGGTAARGVLIWSTTTGSLLQWSGTAWLSLAAGLPYDAHAYVSGAPENGEVLIRVPLARAVTFSANFAGSYANAETAATASTVLIIRRNGTQIGTVTFASAGTSGTFASTGGATQSFSAGDVFSVEGPATADATLAGIGFALAGTRG